MRRIDKQARHYLQELFKLLDKLAKRSQSRSKSGATILAVAFVLAGLTACTRADNTSDARPIRLGYLNNITHAQALVSIAQDNLLARASGLGEIEMRAFNTGPEAIDAMTSGDLDAAYVGPTGAINAFYRTQGNLIAIVSGAASGGARLMVAGNSAVRLPGDFAGKTIAVPGIGNTQDVALRTWLTAQGLKPREQGGSVSIRPIANPEIFNLIIRGHLDAAWVPEPWATRLEAKAGARTFLDERDLWPDGQFSSVALAVSQKFLRSQPERVRQLVDAHTQVTAWILANREAAIADANLGLEKSLGKSLEPVLASQAFDRFTVTVDPLTPTVGKIATAMVELGYLPRKSEVDDIATLFELKNLKATGAFV